MQVVRVSGVLLLVAVLLLGGVPFLVGTLLPERHRASASRNLAHPISAVWAAVNDPRGDARANSEVERLEMLPSQVPGMLRYRETYRDGDYFQFAVVERRAPVLLVTRIEEASFPVGGRWRIDLERLPRGTKVTVTEEGSIQSAYLRFLSRYVLGHTATMTEYLERLERRLAGAAGASPP